MLLKKMILIFLIFLLGTSCGKYVEKAIIDSKIKDNEVSMIFDMTLQNVQIALPVIQAPIKNPSNNEIIGKLNIQEGNSIFLELNISRIFKDAIALECNLPNGNPLPLVFNGSERTFCFDAANKKFKIYVAVEGDLAIAGIAVPMKKLEPTEMTEPHEYFSGFSLGETNGVAGTFIGTAPGESGIALFINFSGWLPVITNEEIADMENFTPLASHRIPRIRIPYNAYVSR